MTSFYRDPNVSDEDFSKWLRVEYKRIADRGGMPTPGVNSWLGRPGRGFTWTPTRGYDPRPPIPAAELQEKWGELSSPSYWDNINKMKEESRERYGNRPSLEFGDATGDQVSNNENVIRNSINKPRITSQTFG